MNNLQQRRIGLRRIPLLKGAAIALLLVAAAVVYEAYRRDIVVAQSHAVLGSHLVATSCGSIEYAEAGAGRPVLVVHGAGGGFDQGLYFAAPLANKGFRVIAVSRFGYLRTPLPPDASAEAQARAHACLLDALHIPRVAIIGASAGAPSSVLFALRYPERTAALVLLVPAMYVPREADESPLRSPPGTELLLNTALRSDFLFWAASHVAHQAVSRSILATPPEVIANASHEEQERVAQVLESILPVTPRRLGLVNDVLVTSTLKRYDLEHIMAPTFVMSTADDLYGTFDAARYTAEHIPGAKFLGFEKGGHLWVGHHQEVLSALAEFVGTAGTVNGSPPDGTRLSATEQLRTFPRALHSVETP
jgi:2-hydroxy-6-oxonona-2,4-dienedioate hydrolase